MHFVAFVNIHSFIFLSTCMGVISAHTQKPAGTRLGNLVLVTKLENYRNLAIASLYCF